MVYKRTMGVNPLCVKISTKIQRQKALVSAFAAFFAGNTGNDNDKDAKSPPYEKEENNHKPTKDQLAFLSMVGSLKE
jgi:hypothetical protein